MRGPGKIYRVADFRPIPFIGMLVLAVAVVMVRASPSAAEHLPAFTQPEYLVNEDAGKALITVKRPDTKGVAISTYTTGDGTASAGGDYGRTTGTLRFEDGESTKTFTVALVDDVATEDDETILLTLNVSSRPDGVDGGAPQPGSSAKIVIVGNDGGTPGTLATEPSPPGTPGGAIAFDSSDAPGAPPREPGVDGGEGPRRPGSRGGVGSAANSSDSALGDAAGSADDRTGGAASSESERGERSALRDGDAGNGDSKSPGWVLPVALAVLFIAAPIFAWKAADNRRVARALRGR